MANTPNLNLKKFTGADYVRYEDFNDNFDILDELGKDYITEVQNSGNWHIEKWKSGFCELTYTEDLSNIPITQVHGGGYFWTKPINFPVTFDGAPACFTSVGGHDLVLSHTHYPGSSGCTFYLISFTPLGAWGGEIFLKVEGSLA